MVLADWEDKEHHSYFGHLVTHNKMIPTTKSLIQEQMLRNLLIGEGVEEVLIRYDF